VAYGSRLDHAGALEMNQTASIDCDPFADVPPLSSYDDYDSPNPPSASVINIADRRAISHRPALVDAGGRTLPSTMADFRGRAPERKWIVQDWIPSGVVTGLYGDGGVGKTLLALQLQASMSLGRKWLGVEVENCTSLGVYCEDDQDELHRRRDDISDAMDCDTKHLDGAILWPRLGEDNLLMTFTGRGGKGELTPFHKELMERAQDERAKVVLFDGAADGFGGDEINRNQVRAFVQIACGSIARAIGGAFVLLAHPSLSGTSSGRGTSGSTGWSNAFRSRLYLDFARDDAGNPDLTNADARTLERMKANYASRGDRLELKWQGGVIVRERTQAVERSDRRPLTETFLSLFKVHSERQNLSPAATANNSAAAIFARLKRDEREGYTKRDFAEEMGRLLKSGVLKIEEYGRDKSKKLALATLCDAPATLCDA
jgi:RecA-family ATPase